MSRAVRRQQAKAERASKARAAPARAIPSTGAKGPARKETRRSLVPRFLADIISELRKVVWPTRDDVMHLTVVVVIVTVILGAVLGAVDIGFGWLVDNTILQR
jgi:preprotein translocase subunit SecE